jgi:transposase
MHKRVSTEFKESILKKVVARGSKTLSDIAKECGLSVSTLSKWSRESGSQKNGTMPDRAEQFRHLKAISQMNEIEVGAYCRQHGLYSMHLKEWENNFMKQDASDQKYKAENIALRKKNAELERELRRKEKALAETAALLVLKKKVDAIWGEDEDA